MMRLAVVTKVVGRYLEECGWSARCVVVMVVVQEKDAVAVARIHKKHASGGKHGRRLGTQTAEKERASATERELNCLLH